MKLQTDTICQTDGLLVPMVGLVPVEKNVIPMVLLMNMHLIKGTLFIFPYHFLLVPIAPMVPTEIARIYKALTHSANFQGPICYNNVQNKEISLIVY